ncbi:hypothetical protein [Brachybacterium alimentarium]|uniref:hypothetical protein n=1 Tax=Brachybacterium alimentarium TaxID=47845 RepID=UPI003FD6AE82
MSNDTRIPWADSSDDITTRTIPLDGGTAIVEHTMDHVEVTIRLGQRIAAALVLSPTEADALGMALARPGGFTVGDYWDMCDQLKPTHAV